MDIERTSRTFLVEAGVALAMLVVICGGMREGAATGRQGGPVAAVLTSDYAVMPPAIRDEVLRGLRREAAPGPGHSAATQALARECYRALVAQTGGDAPARGHCRGAR